MSELFLGLIFLVSVGIIGFNIYQVITKRTPLYIDVRDVLSQHIVTPITDEVDYAIRDALTLWMKHHPGKPDTIEVNLRGMCIRYTSNNANKYREFHRTYSSHELTIRNKNGLYEKLMMSVTLSYIGEEGNNKDTYLHIQFPSNDLVLFSTTSWLRQHNDRGLEQKHFMEILNVPNTFI